MLYFTINLEVSLPLLATLTQKERTAKMETMIIISLASITMLIGGIEAIYCWFKLDYQFRPEEVINIFLAINQKGETSNDKE